MSGHNRTQTRKITTDVLTEAESLHYLYVSQLGLGRVFFSDVFFGKKHVFFVFKTAGEKNTLFKCFYCFLCFFRFYPLNKAIKAS